MRTLPICSALLLLVGCDTWNRVNGPSWERGSPSAADWNTPAGRPAPTLIPVIEPHCTQQPCFDADYIETCYNAIGHLLATARPVIQEADAFDSQKPVLYATTVDLNDFNQTTNFGRVISESLATALTQHWRNKVIKMNVGDQFRISPRGPGNGQLLLSRDVSELASEFNAGAFLLSSYSVSIDKVYIHVELVNALHQEIVASVAFAIPLGPRTEALLKDYTDPDSAKAMFTANPGFVGRGNAHP